MQSLIPWLESFAQQVPLPWFIIIGAFIEEIIAPIPSPLVMMLGGTISASQNHPLIFLFFLAIIGAGSKTLGSFILYKIADVAEDVIIDKFGKFLGVSHQDTEGLGKTLSKGKRDDLTIFIMRAVPIMPTAPVSIMAGLMKTNLRTYLISTFLGLIVRNMIYLYLGYTSLGTLESLSEGFDSLEKIGYLILLILAGLGLVWMYRKRQQGTLVGFIEKIQSRIKKLFMKR